jgi:hypothetical protein
VGDLGINFRNNFIIKLARFNRASLIVECISGGERGMAKKVSRDADPAGPENRRVFGEGSDAARKRYTRLGLASLLRQQN